MVIKKIVENTFCKMGKNAKNNAAINNPFKSKFVNNFKNKFSNTNNKSKAKKPNLKAQWGKEKFVPKVSGREKQPIGEEATPWGHYKTELLEKKKEEAHANAVDMNSAAAKDILKQREQNFRRTMIESQAKQTAKWEKFDDDEAKEKSSNSKAESKNVQKYHNKKTTQTNNFAGISLKNFDAKKLTFKQNNDMRKVLTKGLMNVKDKSLAGVVNDMKRKKQKKKEEFHSFDNSKKQQSKNPFRS